MIKTVYYVEFFDVNGSPRVSKPYALYLKPGTAKVAAQTSLTRHAPFVRGRQHQTGGSRVYELTGDLVLIEEYGTVVEHVEGQEPLFEL